MCVCVWSATRKRPTLLYWAQTELEFVGPFACRARLGVTLVWLRDMDETRNEKKNENHSMKWKLAEWKLTVLRSVIPFFESLISFFFLVSFFLGRRGLDSKLSDFHTQSTKVRVRLRWRNRFSSPYTCLRSLCLHTRPIHLHAANL